MVLSSTHKIVGSLTQSAILHLGRQRPTSTRRVVDRAVTLIESTSPNALLTASLDAARRQAVTHGDELLGETSARCASSASRYARSRASTCSTSASSAGRGVFAYDPLSARRRRPRHRGHRPPDRGADARQTTTSPSSSSPRTWSSRVFGMGEHVERLRPAADRGAAACGRRGWRERGRPWALRDPAARGARRRCRPREAFLGPQEVIPFADAEGRIAAESLAAYPPGVPNVLPGEIAHRADAALHLRLARPRRLGPGRQRPDAEDRQGGGEMNWGVDSEHGVTARRAALPARELPLASHQRDLGGHPRQRPRLRPRRRPRASTPIWSPPTTTPACAATSSSRTRRCPTRCSPATRA